MTVAEEIQGSRHAHAVSLLRDLFDHVCCLPIDQDRHKLIQAVSEHLGASPQFNASTDPVYSGKRKSEHGYVLIEASLDGNRLDLYFPDPYVPGEDLARRQEKIASIHEAEFLGLMDEPVTIELEANPMSNATEHEHAETLKVIQTVIEHLKKTARVPMTREIYRSAEQQLDELDHFGPQIVAKPDMRGQIITPAGVVLVDVQLVANTLSVQFGKAHEAQNNLWVMERQRRAHKGRLLRHIGRRSVLTLVRNKPTDAGAPGQDKAAEGEEDLGY